ncbi:GntR family transcriptional regulator [Amycolatopsis sp. Poz14]|uniref:GntR family transcriptional regulator n=1 Tax=Amycolatopsis sp. Poz14 TaxID=1447705 RepID=UPI001EE8C04F|nr:GntR family transcriptional regulator [Amycolatopsis sp. Poz14]MCG3757121.1 GntR family transcriptional regulator [Amycolatopsis sp. Poz14]
MIKPPKRAATAAQAIRQFIADELQAGDQLPSEAEFARRLGVSRVTVREALGQLWVEGLVTRRWGVGTFVRDTSAPLGGAVTNIYVDIADVGSLPHKIEAAGHTPALSHAKVDRIDGADEAARELGLHPGDPIWRVERCLTIDGVPAIVLRDHIPLRLNGVDFPADRLTDLDADLPSLMQRIGLRVVRDEARLDAVAADPSVARLLRLADGAPVLHARQASHADTGEIVVSTSGYYRSDVFTFMLVRTTGT